MALLDFIKNRGGQAPAAEQQAPQQQPAENYKQSMTRQDTEDRATAKPIALNQEQAASAKDASDLFRKGTQAPEQSPSSPAPTPADGATDPQQPMVQPSMNQDKAAPALSPTSAQAGLREHEQETPASDSPSPSPSPSNAPGRRPPSWER